MEICRDLRLVYIAARKNARMQDEIEVKNTEVAEARGELNKLNVELEIKNEEVAKASGKLNKLSADWIKMAEVMQVLIKTKSNA